MKFPGSYDSVKLSTVTCSVGHFRHFTENPKFREWIQSDADYITNYGLQAYLRREYTSRGDGKAIILNDVGGEINCVDGNRHIAAILLAAPRVTIGQIKEAVRFWCEGHEYLDESRLNYDAYTVYIPYDIDTRELVNNSIPVNIIRDGFKEDHPLTKEIPGNIRFSDSKFTAADRGRKFSELIELLGT